MTPSEYDAYLRAIKAHAATTRTKEQAHAYLVELGTHNPDGTLTKEYGGEYTTPREQEPEL